MALKVRSGLGQLHTERQAVKAVLGSQSEPGVQTAAAAKEKPRQRVLRWDDEPSSVHQQKALNISSGEKLPHHAQAGDVVSDGTKALQPRQELPL